MNIGNVFTSMLGGIILVVSIYIVYLLIKKLRK